MLHTFEAPQPSLHYGTTSTPASAPIPTTNGSTVKTLPEMNNLTHHHIFIVTGPAGCGKSTVAKYLADRYDFHYIEGDDVRISNTLK